MRILNIAKKVPIHPTFFLLALWFFVSDMATEFFVLFFVVLFHELAHYFTAKKLGYRLTSFYLAPYGAQLSYKDEKFSFKDEMLIALAGPLANMILCVFLLALWWIAPGVYCYTNSIFECSLFIGLFNLLPAYPLDGGRAFVALLSEKTTRQTALKISIIFNIVFCIIFAACFVISCFYSYNPTFVMMIFFLLCGILDSKFEGKYERVDVLNKKIKNLSSVKSVYVDDTATLSQLFGAIDSRKFTIFYVNFSSGQTKIMTEKNVIKLCKNHPLTIQIKELNFK